MEINLRDLKRILSSEESSGINIPNDENGFWKIVILQRGWVYVGKYLERIITVF